MTQERQTEERPPAAAGAAQQQAGPKPAPPFTAHPPKPPAAPKSETAFTDADVPAAPDRDDDPKAAQPPAGEADEVGTGGDTPAEIRAQEYLDLAQRTRAELENFRKRAARDAAAAADRGTARLAKELLPAFDHLDLALQHAPEDSELAKGIRLVQDEIAGALARVGIEAFSPKGETFDPNEHEAVAQHPVEGAEAGTVADVYQPGYRLNGTVLRPARVVVAA